MTISLTRLSGGNTPADGSDPRTFPAIWNASATAIENAIATIPEGGASVTVSETAPVSPAEGDLWLNSTEAKMYVYYDDGTSAQWVAAVGGTVPSQGKILQVVSTTKTDLFSTTSTTNVDITGLSVSITPSATSSKIFVVCNVVQGHSNSGYWNYLTLLRDSTAINVGTGGTTDNSTATIYTASGFANSSVSITALDSPSSTSALTYKVQMRIKAGGGTGRINSLANVGSEGSSSTITVMEVAG